MRSTPLALSWVICLLVLLIPHILPGQAPLDSTRAIQLRERAQAFADSAQWDSAILYRAQSCDQWLRLAEQQQDSLSWNRYFRAKLKQAALYSKTGQGELGLEMLQYISDQIRKKWGEDHLLLGNAYLRMGNFHNQLRHPGPADSLYLESLRIFREHLPSTTTLIAGVIRNRGTLQMNQKNLPQAQALLKEALTMYQQAPDSNRLEIGETYHSLANVAANLEQNQEALSLSAKAQEIYESELSPFHQNVGLLLTSQANILARLGKYAEARDRYLRADKVFLRAVGPNHPYRANNYFSLSTLYRIQGDYPHALEYALKSFRAFQASLPATHPSLGRINVQLGDLSRNLGNYPKASEYYTQARFIYEQNYAQDHPVMGGFWMAVGNGYYEMLEYEQAIASYEKSLPIYRAQLGENSKYVAGLLGNLGSAHEGIQQFEQALAYHQQANQMLQALSEEISPMELARSEQLLGIVRLRMGQYEAAVPYFRKADARYRKDVAGTHPEIASNCNFLALSLLKQGKKAEALQYYQQALTANLPSYSPTSPTDLPEAAARPLHVLIYLHTLQAIAQAWCWEEEFQRDHWEQAAQALSIASAQIADLRHHVGKDSEKMDVQQRYGEILQARINLTYELFIHTNDSSYLDQFFYTTEQARAVILQEGLRSARSLEMAGVPETVSRREDQLRTSLGEIEEELLRLNNLNDKDPDAIRLLQQKQLSQSRSYDSLLQVIETTYPRYYQLKYANPGKGWREVQQALPDAETHFISYYLPPDRLAENSLRDFPAPEEHLYVCAISQRGISLRRKRISQSWREDLKQYRNWLQASDIVSEFGNKLAYQQEFGQLSLRLFDGLIGPEWEKTPQKLVIVAGGELGYLPFETLLTNAPKEGWSQAYNHWPFLLFQSQVRYAFSASLWLEDIPASAAKQFLLGFGPAYVASAADSSLRLGQPSAEFELPPLLHNQKEVADLCALMDGKAFLGADANEASFRKYAPDYQVLHLAMHSVLNEENPLYSGLAFGSAGLADSLADPSQDNLLYSYEIYRLSLQAELVVLSACNSGSGNLQAGEGIFSLGRAFRYAGVPNIVMSLWQVDDQATANLMEAFYQALSEGKGKAEALQQAKMVYLSQSKRAHPFYWASFILIGEDTPIQAKEARYSPWMLGLLALLLLGGGIWWLRRENGPDVSVLKNRIGFP